MTTDGVLAMADNEPLSFSYKNTKRLIQMIRSRPCLWARQSPDYKDRLARDRAWAEVFAELDPRYNDGDTRQRHEIATSVKERSSARVIQMIRSRPCLWARQAPDYKDRLARDRAWAEVFAELDPRYNDGDTRQRHETGSNITKKWYNIRDSYVKSLKPDCLGRRNRPYIHAEFLRFLDDCYVDKLNSSHLEMMNRSKRETRDEEIEEFDTEDVEPEPWEHKVFVSLEEEEPTPTKRPRLEYSPDQNVKDNTKVRDEDDIIAILSNLIQKEEDEDRAFFKSITPSVKKLTEDSKFVFRIEVLKLIKNLRAKEETITMKFEKTAGNESESE